MTVMKSKQYSLKITARIQKIWELHAFSQEEQSALKQAQLTKSDHIAEIFKYV